ncbi:MAG: hypothetical protein ACTHLE_04100 [Agriterribacter sp.]
MPTITNKRNGKSWHASEEDAVKIEQSTLRHLYKIDRVYEPDEVKELREKMAVNPAEETPPVVKKAKPRKTK